MCVLALLFPPLVVGLLTAHARTRVTCGCVSYPDLADIQLDSQPAKPQNTSCMIHSCIALQFFTSDHIPDFASSAQTY